MDVDRISGTVTLSRGDDGAGGATTTSAAPAEPRPPRKIINELRDEKYFIDVIQG